MAKDISRCYGLLKDYEKETEIIESESNKVRKRKWRSADFQHSKPKRGSRHYKSLTLMLSIVNTKSTM